MMVKKKRIYEGTVGIVTGAASGIGRALSEELAKQGCEVVLADLQIELAEEAAAKIRACGGKAEAHQVDVSDFEALQALVKETAARTGRLDYMFNNAGIGVAGEVSFYGLEDWNRIIDVNLRGVTHGIQAAYPLMLEQGSGHIVNTASMAGLVPMPVLVGYAATKHAVVGLSKSLRIEAAWEGINVSVICPGVIDTAILDYGGKYGKMLVEIPPDVLAQTVKTLRPMDANLFARKVLKKVARNKAIIIVPFWWKIFWWLNRFSPSLGLYLGSKFYSRARKEVGTPAPRGAGSL